MADLTGLNEKIASWFEPKPTFVPVKPEPSSDFTKDWESPKYFWRWDCRAQTWVSAPDFLHDEAANARLLEAMPNCGLEHYEGKWWIDGDTTQPGGIFGDPDRKTAIVLAFCKWANITVEEEL